MDRTDEDPSERRGLPDGPPRLPGPALAAAAGALWGLGGYMVLWGHVPLVVSRTFVQSPLGTVALLPVRVVLWAILFYEEVVVGHPVHLADNNWWIGLVASAIGALSVAGAYLLVRALLRRVRT